jgi:hypothetical protein
MTPRRFKFARTAERFGSDTEHVAEAVVTDDLINEVRKVIGELRSASGASPPLNRRRRELLRDLEARIQRALLPKFALSIDEFAASIRVSRATIYNCLADKAFAPKPPVKEFRGRTIVPIDSIPEWLEKLPAFTPGKGIRRRRRNPPEGNGGSGAPMSVGGPGHGGSAAASSHS